MNEASKSSHPEVLKVTRIISFVLISYILFYYGISDNRWAFFVYLTHWGMISTFSFFLFSILNYWVPYLESTTSTLFLIIWAVNWCITLAFWGYLVPVAGLRKIFRGTVTHSLPLLVTIVEFSLNSIPFYRKRFLVVFLFLALYFATLFVPYTLNVRPIYKGIDFDGVVDYLVLFAVFLIALLSLEGGKYLKELMVKSRDKRSGIKESLLDNGPEWEMREKV